MLDSSFWNFREPLRRFAVQDHEYLFDVNRSLPTAVLATCRTYLLLIDALQHDGKSEGKLGFERSSANDTTTPSGLVAQSCSPISVRN